MGNTTHDESVQSLQSVKLLYQPCSRTLAARKIDIIVDHLMMMLLMMTILMMNIIHVYDHVV